MTKHRIDTPTSRSKLKPRRNPYWVKLDARRYLGFRAGSSTWIARWHARPGSTAPYDYQSLGSQPTFSAAKEAAEKWFGAIEQAQSHYSVEELVQDYVTHRRLENGGKSAHEAELLLAPALVNFEGREVASLTTKDLKRWRDSFVPLDADEEAQRRAKSTANKRWSALRAALTLAFNDQKVAHDSAWRRVKSFDDVDRARLFYPTEQQVAALIDHCDDDFRPLVKALVLTGWRMHVLKEARVSDFNPKEGTLKIDRDKDHPRTATLSSAATALFKEQAKDKVPTAYLFLRADGLPWGVSHQHRRFRAAAARANADTNVKKEARCPREFIPYSLRHYFISRALLAGVHVNALAENVGTSVKMIEKVYGKFRGADVRDMLDRVEVA